MPSRLITRDRQEITFLKNIIGKVAPRSIATPISGQWSVTAKQKETAGLKVRSLPASQARIASKHEKKLFEKETETGLSGRKGEKKGKKIDIYM